MLHSLLYCLCLAILKLHLQVPKGEAEALLTTALTSIRTTGGSVNWSMIVTAVVQFSAGITGHAATCGEDSLLLALYDSVLALGTADVIAASASDNDRISLQEFTHVLQAVDANIEPDKVRTRCCDGWLDWRDDLSACPAGGCNVQGKSASRPIHDIPGTTGAHSAERRHVVIKGISQAC